MIQESHFWEHVQNNHKQELAGNFVSHVHKSTIYSNQKVEGTYAPSTDN